MAGKPIVVGVDLSPESLRAFELAAQIADAWGAPLVPVHAVPVVPAFTGVVGVEPLPVFSPELQEEVNRAARQQVLRALERTQAPGAAQRLEVRTGPAPFVLGDVARGLQAELVVLGGKQHGALARGLGRSTAHYLVRTLDIPVLVARETAKRMARVLVAVDFSEASLPCVKAAERFAHRLGARIRLLHVVEPLPFEHLLPDTVDPELYYRRLEGVFGRFASRFEAVAPEDRVLRRGVAVEVIAGEADAWQADVIVVGSHGKGWVDRVLVGSTTQRLVTELPTSILVVPVKAPRRATAIPKAPRRAREGRGRARRGSRTARR